MSVLVETAIDMVEVASEAADTTTIAAETLIVTVAMETRIKIAANCVRE